MFLKRNKTKGFLMVSAALTAVVFILLAGTMVGMYSGIFSTMESSRMAAAAQQYAEIEANALTLFEYDKLNSAAHGKANIDGSEGWQSEAVIGPEKIIGDHFQRIGTVKIYKNSESIPRATLQVPLSSQGSGGVPVGTVIAWPTNTLPNFPGVWLECDGRSCSSYPKLAAVLGSSNVPDYRNVFLQGSNVAGVRIAAGLPNITGMVGYWNDSFGLASSGALFYQYAYDKGQASGGGTSYSIHFNAARSNPIYGGSNTVQPPAVTVKFLIKAQ